MSGVNIPLLRKAVEWAEAEAAKPVGGVWVQSYWCCPPDARPNSYEAMVRVRAGLDASCGTSYCIAGYVVAMNGEPIKVETVAKRAADLLGIEVEDDSLYAAASLPLFAAINTIEDVRRIAEELAGERL